MPGAATAHWAHVACRAPVQKYMCSSSQSQSVHRVLHTHLYPETWQLKKPSDSDLCEFKLPVLPEAGLSCHVKLLHILSTCINSRALLTTDCRKSQASPPAHLGLVFIGDVWELLLKFSLLLDIFCLIISLRIVCPPYYQAYLGKCARDTTLKPLGTMT